VRRAVGRHRGDEGRYRRLMIGILCRGHCILQGMPGLARRCSSQSWRR
jgi:hypothetical protein